MKKIVILYYFVFFSVIPWVIALLHFAVKGFNYKALVFEIGIGLCFAWAILIKVLSIQGPDDVFKNLAIPSFCCLTFPIFVFAVPVFVVLNSQEIRLEEILKVINAETCLLVLIVIFVFIGYYFKYFIPDPKDVQEFEELSFEPLNFLKKHPKLNFLPGIVVFVFFLGVYLYCLIGLNHCITTLDFSAKFYLDLIYLILTPLMMFGGISISQLGLSFDLKLNVFTGLFGLAPVLIFLILYLKFPDYQQIFQYFLALSPFFTVFWSSQSSVKSKILFSWTLSFSCVFIAFPLGFLLPFGLFGEFELIAVYSVLGFFLLFPASSVVYYFWKNLSEFCSRSKIEKREIVKKTTCYKTSLFLITTIFILSEGTLLFMYFTAPFSSPATGAVLGMLIVISVLYMTTSLTMQVTLDRALNLRLSISLLIVFAALVVISAILSSVLAHLGPDAEVACITCCIGFILLMILTLALLQFKYRNPDVGKLLMIVCNLTLWTFFVLPLGVGLPSALSRAKDSKSRNRIIGVATIFIGIVFMVGVSFFSILYNVYQKRMERERKAIQCCSTVANKLKSHQIKCSMLNARIVYDKYSLHDFKRIDVNAWMAGFEFKDMQKSTKYRREYKSKGAIPNGANNKSNSRSLTFWELLNCFDNKDYIVESDDSDNDSNQEEAVQSENSIKAIDLSMMDKLSYEEFTKIRPNGLCPDFSINYKDVPNVDEKKLKVDQFTQLFRQNYPNLENDKSARKDWLGVVFDILAFEPVEEIHEKWISEKTLLLFLKHGGITEEMISNKKLKMLYSHLTLENKYPRPFKKTVWVEEMVPELAKPIFPTIDLVKREKMIIVDCFLTNLKKNFVGLCKELEAVTIQNSQNDPFRKYLNKIKTKDMICSDRSDLNKYIIRNESSENSGETNEGLLNPAESSAFGNQFYLWFINNGKKINNFFNEKSKSLQNYLKKFYKGEEKAAEVKEDNGQNFGFINQIDDANIFILDTIDEVLKSRTDKQQSVEKISCSGPNIITIIIKILEIYQLSSLGFKKDVNWNFFREPLAKTSDVMLVENNPYFIPVFWVCFSIAILYVPIAWYSKAKIINANIGKNSAGDAEKITTSEGLRKFIILLVGSQLYMLIMKSQLTVFACNVNEDPPVLWNTDINCYETFHIAHFFCAIGCVMLYYPIATFIYPILQFNDSKLQIKFQTTFVIILSQTKLIITAVTVFLPYQFYLRYQLIISSVVIFLLFLYFTIKKPCLARKFNNWMSAGYFLAFLANFMAMINLEVGGSIIINILFFILAFITVVVAIVQHKRGVRANLKIVQPIFELTTSRMHAISIDTSNELRNLN